MIPKLIAIFRSEDSEAGTVSSISAPAPSGVVSNEPAFKKEGELTFPKIQKKISIEIADNDAETTQGLMYRKSMPDTCGMLFVFPDSQERSFWMKNTFIPLDLLFINSNKEVITIQPNRPPFSEEAIPSYKPAQYVLEVNAGFCQRNGIKQGDKISF
ncbi:hypothetical protein BWI92_00370 [Flectobacillus sp. BAB-3569]|nr:hypothetical protein BWI92_00370 [Flectobacillus sp. BAB-3569]